MRRTKTPERRRAPDEFVQKSGRDGGGKPRPDYGPPNLSPRALNVVRVRFSLIKTRLDAGTCIPMKEAPAWSAGLRPTREPTLVRCRSRRHIRTKCERCSHCSVEGRRSPPAL